jgi:hypothetical protein
MNALVYYSTSDELEGMRQEAVEGSQCPGRDSNFVPPEVQVAAPWHSTVNTL